METIESAFDRPRPAAAAMRFGACIVVALALVLLGWVLAPDGASESAPGRPTPNRDEVPEVDMPPPAPLSEPDPMADPYSVDEPDEEPAPSSGQWCADSGAHEPDSAPASWETARLVSHNATYTLRHPGGWEVADEPGDYYLVTSPDADVMIEVAFVDAGGMSAADVIARGGELFAQQAPTVNIERSERATVAGVPGCRLVGNEAIDGQRFDGEMLWTIVSDEVVAAALYTEPSLGPSEKEIGRMVLNSLAADDTDAA